MAKLQFGDSFCQIEGLYVPVADVNLAGSDSIYFTHHILLWKDPQVNITTMPLAAGWKRMFAGLPLIMTQAHGPGHIAFSRDAPGEMIALPLQPGEEVDVREHLFMLATNNVAYDWFSTNVWYTTGIGRRDGDALSCRHVHGPLFGAASARPAVVARRRQRVRAGVGARPDHPGKADRAHFQGPGGPDAIAFRTSRTPVSACGAIGRIAITGCDCGAPAASPSNRFSIGWKARTGI